MRRAALLVFALGGCQPAAPSDDARPMPVERGPQTTEGRASAPSPIVPRSDGPFAPSRVMVTDDSASFGAVLASDGPTCEPCHAEIVAQWRGSAHAAASFDNPLYRVSVEAFREAKGAPASRMCAGCHDLALLVDGVMDAPVQARDSRAHAGISCSACHGIVEATPDGNGSFRLRRDAVAMPVEGDAASLRAHRKRMASPALGSPAMCGSCHRSFLGPATGHDHHLVGLDDLGSWRQSVYAGSRLDRLDDSAERTCVDCHMPSVAAPAGDAAADDGKVRSHRFAGGHSWLAAMQQDEAQLRAIQAMLRSAATLRVAAVRGDDGVLRLPADGATVSPGEPLTLELVLRNVGAGHRFPGGTRDALDTWVEVELRDGDGAVVAEAGRGWREGRADASLHRLHATILDVEGRPVNGRAIERFAAKGYDRSVLPRDRALYRYRLTLPAAEAPARFVVEARLLHRSREPELQRRACAEHRSARGRRWAAERAARGRPPLDPCAPQPITVLAEDRATLVVGEGERPEVDPMLAIDHGAAWAHALVEEIDRARGSYDLALQTLGADDRTARATALLGLAAVAARQGRIPEMEGWLSRAAGEVSGHPAYAWVRGRALASVWRHDQAARWLRVAAAGAPEDARAWAALAMAQGSLGRHAMALAASAQALALKPRHPDALRAQALAVRGLGLAPEVAESTFQAFLAHRRRDDGSDLRARCSMDVAGCATERTPNHLHPMIP